MIDHTKEPWTEHEQNARRIFACVNAFAGIDLEKFEGKSVAEYLTSQTMLSGMGPDERGGFSIQLEGGACRLLAETFGEQFKQSGAINFLEINFDSKVVGPLSVTMQRAQGKTPGQLLADARAQRDELLEALKEAAQHLENYAVTVEGEYRAGRTIEELEEEDDLPDYVLNARAVIAKFEAK